MRFLVFTLLCHAHTESPLPLAETNRKCPRWAEFNSGTPPMPTASASSPPATSPTASTAGFGFGKGSESLFSPGALPSSSGNSLLRPPTNAASASSLAAHGPSPLATSPPVMAMEDDAPATPSTSAPKIKLTLSKKS